MSASISFRGVGKIFSTNHKSVEALNKFSMEITPNSFVALVGPSGCGKSSLLQIAAGLDTAYIGECSVSPLDCHKAVLFQSPRLLPWLTIEQNIAFIVCNTNGTTYKKALREAQLNLQLVGLAGFEKSFPNHLSGGMQQRAALARALAVNPQVLLMDEPLAALDEITARRIRSLLTQIHLECPRTVLFVTHNISEAVFLADHVGVISPRPGRLIAQIPVSLPRPRNYDDPALALVAQDVVRYLESG